MDPLPPRFAETRSSLHALAEHVLAPARHAETGRIGLRVEPDGVATPPYGAGVQVLVRGDEVVVRGQGTERAAPATTVAAAAELVGIAPGAPRAVYAPTTALEPDAPLVLDRDAMAAALAWLTFADRVLVRAAGVGPDGWAVEPTLWPEHLDIAVTVDAVNLGGSLGDEHVDEPYLYVGPWARPLPGAGEGFWNAPFGAVLRRSEVLGLDDALAFLHRGLAVAR